LQKIFHSFEFVYYELMTSKKINYIKKSKKNYRIDNCKYMKDYLDIDFHPKFKIIKQKLL